MSSHVHGQREGVRPSRRGDRNGLLNLGWLHFWVLSGVLAGLLGMTALVFLASTRPL